MNNHELTIEQGYMGLEGLCSCSDPDWTDSGWDGQVTFLAATREEIIDLHHDHVLELEGVSL